MIRGRFVPFIYKLRRSILKKIPLIINESNYQPGGDDMQETHVVTCFLENGHKILLLRRSRQVGSYEQKWAGISGYIEEGQTPTEQAWQEIGEEAALAPSDLVLLQEGEPLPVVDEKLDRTWVVHPFRFALADPDKVKIDWEHSECKWVDPWAIKDHDCVPGLWAAWLRVE